MYVCMYVYIYIYIYINNALIQNILQAHERLPRVFELLSAFPGSRICKYIYIYIYMYMISLSLYIYIHKYMYVYTYIYIYIYTSLPLSLSIYIYIYIGSRAAFEAQYMMFHLGACRGGTQSQGWGPSAPIKYIAHTVVLYG